MNRIKRLMVVIAVSIMILGGTAYAENMKNIFSAPDLTRWTASPRSLKLPTFVNNEFGIGFKFIVDFTNVNPKYPRCYWDAAFSTIDISKEKAIVIKAHITNSHLIKKIGFYVNSNKQWYLAKPVTNLVDGMNNLVFQLNKFNRDGRNESIKNSNVLNQVNRIRINVFRRIDNKKLKPIVTLYNIATTAEAVAMKAILFTPPTAIKLGSRSEKQNKSGKLLESRMIFDENGSFLRFGIDKVLGDISRAGFNAYMPVVWHGRGTLYPSSQTKFEPRYKKYFSNSDAIKELISKAHAKGIEVHPAFCVAYRGNPDPHPEFTTIGVPKRAYDLQDPKFRDLIVKEIVDFALKYNVDGINLDYIRTRGVSYSKIATKLYKEKYNADISELKNYKKSAKLKKRLLEWQRDAVSDIVSRIAQGIKQTKPQITISVCGHPLRKPMLQNEGRNSWLWAEQGWVDVVYSMDYTWRPNFELFAEVRNATNVPEKFVLMLGNYDKQAGKTVSRRPEQVAKLIDYALRQFPGNGIALYWYSSLNNSQMAALKTGPFKKTATAHWSK